MGRYIDLDKVLEEFGIGEHCFVCKQKKCQEDTLLLIDVCDVLTSQPIWQGEVDGDTEGT